MFKFIYNISYLNYNLHIWNAASNMSSQFVNNDFFAIDW